MKKIGTIIGEKLNKNRPKNLSTEFQVFGVYLCEQLQDTTHYSLYMRLAKTVDRKLLEEALNFCKDYSSAKSLPKLFLWKLKQLKDETKIKS